MKNESLFVSIARQDGDAGLDEHRQRIKVNDTIELLRSEFPQLVFSIGRAMERTIEIEAPAETLNTIREGILKNHQGALEVSDLSKKVTDSPQNMKKGKDAA